MRPLLAADFLRLWERGEGMHGIEQALLVLQHACPESSHEKLSRLSLGERDRRLIELRQKTFGDTLDAYAECPRCGERLEFSMSCQAMSAERQADVPETLTVDGVEFALRALDSRDAAAAAQSASVEEAKRLLAERCAIRKGDFGSWPPSAEGAIAERLLRLDPQAELLLDLSCPACSHSWQDVLDIVSFLWSEIRARARRVLQEVDALARTYGWAERDILEMSDTRRRLYLEMAVS